MRDPSSRVVGVEPVVGVPTFSLNGEPYLLPVMETYDAEGTYFADFAKAGTQVFSMNICAGEGQYWFHDGLETWLGPDQFDYRALDKWVHRALETRPDALIMPRVYIHPPQWWMKLNPEEAELWENGSSFLPADGGNAGYYMHRDQLYPSLASARWREAMAHSLARMLEHIDSSDYADRMFGYLLGGLKSEEWWHWGWSGFGYSARTRDAFQQWLRRRHGTVGTLRDEWRRKDVTFETARVPSREEREYRATTFRPVPEQMNVVDFYRFYNELIPDTIEYFARVIKEATNRTKVVGGFYGFMFEMGSQPECGHNALRRYLASPELDFVFATSGFGNRQLGGCDFARSPLASVLLHGKVFYFDNDYSSHLSTERERQRKLSRPGLTEAEKEAIRTAPPEDFGDGESRGTNLEEDLRMFRRTAGFTLCAGAFQSFFDIASGAYASPEHMAEVARLNAMLERAASRDRSSVAEVLIVTDEDSFLYGSYDSQMLPQRLLHEIQDRWAKLGAPADQILVDDLALVDTSRYKLVIFYNTYHLTDAQRELIARKVKGDGRVVLWCYAPGLFNGNRRDPQCMSELTGLGFHAGPEAEMVAPAIALTDGGGELGDRLRRVGLTVMGPDRSKCQLVCVADPEATALGCLPGTQFVTLALRPMGSWTSVYSITPDLPPAFYRELARYAGVHIWSEKDDTFYANKSYACLHANGPGPRTILFPRPCDLWDAITEESLARGTGKLTRHFEHGETIILRWQ